MLEGLQPPPAHQREASASEGHLPLVSGGKGVTLQEALRLRGEVLSITSPWQGQPQTREQWRGYPSQTGRGDWLGAGKGDGNQEGEQHRTRLRVKRFKF